MKQKPCGKQKTGRLLIRSKQRKSKGETPNSEQHLLVQRGGGFPCSGSQKGRREESSWSKRRLMMNGTGRPSASRPHCVRMGGWKKGEGQQDEKQRESLESSGWRKWKGPRRRGRIPIPHKAFICRIFSHILDDQVLIFLYKLIWLKKISFPRKIQMESID